VEHLKGPLLGLAMALLANIILSWEGWPRKNTLAHYEHSFITAVKSFITLGPVTNAGRYLGPFD